MARPLIQAKPTARLVECRCSHRELTTVLTTTMTTVGLPDTFTYAAGELVSCLIVSSARAYGSRGRFHPLRIRHAVQLACSEPSRRVQFVQFDQHKRLSTDFPSASHAEGRWFDPSRDHTYHRCSQWPRLAHGDFIGAVLPGVELGGVVGDSHCRCRGQGFQNVSQAPVKQRLSCGNECASASHRSNHATLGKCWGPRAHCEHLGAHVSAGQVVAGSMLAARSSVCAALLAATRKDIIAGAGCQCEALAR